MVNKPVSLAVERQQLGTTWGALSPATRPLLRQQLRTTQGPPPPVAGDQLIPQGPDHGIPHAVLSVT